MELIMQLTFLSSTASYARVLAQTDANPVLERSACARGQWQCGNGACVRADRLCDGADDCGDYSDEQRCSMYLVCSIGTSQRSLRARRH